MPIYNTAQYLPEAIDSILNQTYRNLELIAVDDGSEDGSPNILRAYAARDSRIKPIFIDHVFSTVATNHALSHAQGELIARMDSDDIAHPERLAIQVDWMRVTGIQMCGAQAVKFGASQGKLWFPEDHESIGRELFFRVGLLYSTLLAEGHILRQNPFPENVFFDDYEMLVRLHKRYRMGNVQHMLHRHRRHPQQTSVAKLNIWWRELRQHRFRYFFEVYPGTPLREYLPLARLSDRQVFTSVSDLEKAACWLVRLADGNDVRLRQKMASRWEVAHLSAIKAGMVDAPPVDYWRDAILGHPPK
ncbi:MAG: glycosyltransferase family 2 protein [Deltaproteobacteria bacterium]|nr:glycosyltransferase family 2 protein [Deltaproteobacteria bacterium]